MMPHTGKKPYVCTVCDYRASRKFDVTRHMRTHTGAKPFSCTVCEYRTARESDLTRHMKTHTKPFTCPLCDYAAAHEHQLRRHTRSHIDHTAAADSSVAAAVEEGSQCVVCPDPPATTCTSCGDQCLCEDAESIGDFIFLSRKRNDGLCATQL
jgi:hypothetical protein